MTDTLGKILRTIGIILMGLTAAMNLLGGIGTTCAAFLLDNFPSMSELARFQWLYQALVILTVPLGIAGVWSVISLARSKPGSYRSALILLVIGSVLGAIHYYASLSLRGSAAPANMKLYINLITLIVFLLFLLPGIKERVYFSKPKGGFDNSTAGGLTAIVTGSVIITTISWAAPTHTYLGENWVAILQLPLNLVGSALVAGGVWKIGYLIWNAVRSEALVSRSDLVLHR